MHQACTSSCEASLKRFYFSVWIVMIIISHWIKNAPAYKRKQFYLVCKGTKQECSEKYRYRKMYSKGSFPWVYSSHSLNGWSQSKFILKISCRFFSLYFPYPTGNYIFKVNRNSRILETIVLVSLLLTLSR